MNARGTFNLNIKIMKKLLIYLLIVGITGIVHSSVYAQNGQNAFQKGLIQEEGEGNLTKAIEIYNSIVNDGKIDRKLRAKALLHIGICYEKLGDQNAMRTYQKLISEYADQADIVKIGLNNLNKIKSDNPVKAKRGIVASQVWNNAQDSYGISPDGRYINYIDWNNISLNVKDLQTGNTRVVSEIGTWIEPMEFPDNSVWSPDGKKIAYCWIIGSGDDRYRELRIVNVDGSNNKILSTGTRKNSPWPVAWSSDGKFILGITRGNTEDVNSLNLVMISLQEGDIKFIKTVKSLSQGDQMDLSPDNKYVVYVSRQSPNSKNHDIRILSVDGKSDKTLINDPANESSPYWSPDGKEVLFVSDRHGTNDLWKIKVQNGEPIGNVSLVISNISNRTKALLGVSKDNTIFYTSNNVRTDIFIGDLDAGSSNGPVKISNLNTDRNMNPQWSPDGKQLVYSRFDNNRNEKLGHPQHFTLYDTEKKTSKNMDPNFYGNTIMYQPRWSSTGNELLVQGMMKSGQRGGLILYDLKTNTNSPFKVIDNTNIDDINLSYRQFEFSNDDQSAYYLSEDQKSILKYNVKTKQETSILSGDKTIHFFKLSTDNTQIAFGYWFENNKNLYTMPVSGGAKKKIMTFDNCDCADNLIAWGKEDKYIYYKEGEFRDLKKIMRISVDGGTPEEIFDFSSVTNNNGTVTKVSLHPNNSKMAVEFEIGKMEIWKLNGVLNE